MEGNTIKITCTGAQNIPLDDLLEFQGNLKDLTTENYEKLKNSIYKYGFSFPVFFWVDSAGSKWILDAHQRLRVLKKMRDEGFIIPDLPADPIQAGSVKEAKEKLLLLNSRYGKMTQEGFDEFTADINLEEIGDMLVLDDVMFSENNQDFSDKNKEIDVNELAKDLNMTCPRCGFEFKGDKGLQEQGEKLIATSDLPQDAQV